MSLHNKLLHLFPDYRDGDWETQNLKDGSGPRISKWNRPEPQPSQAVIDAISEAQADNAANGRRFDDALQLSRKDRAFIRWIASRTGGGAPAAIKAQLRAAWDAEA